MNDGASQSFWESARILLLRMLWMQFECVFGLSNNLRWPADVSPCIILRKEIWYPREVQGLFGPNGTRTKSLCLGCTRQPASLAALLNWTWNYNIDTFLSCRCASGTSPLSTDVIIFRLLLQWHSTDSFLRLAVIDRFCDFCSELAIESGSRADISAVGQTSQKGDDVDRLTIIYRSIFNTFIV